MTRINVGIPPKELSRAHLIAEHREIKRIPNHLRKHGLKSLQGAPEHFKLGKGHVKFFLNKGAYTYARYKAIYDECKFRELDVTDFSAAWDIYLNHPELFNSWEPTKSDIALIRARIDERIARSKAKRAKK